MTTAETSELPLIVTREWPWGLAFVRDSAWSDPIPSGWAWEHPVYAARGEIVARVLHEVDGQATVEVSHAVPEGLMLVHESEVAIPTGVVAVSDAEEDRVDRAVLPAGLWAAAVWVDDAEHPARVVISLSPR